MAIAMKFSTEMNTLSLDVIDWPLKYTSTILLAFLLLPTTLATAALMLSIEIVVKFQRWMRVPSSS
jgi:hypothetical protein